MKAFKFRSSNQICFAIKIIEEKQLFCADWENLNDPFEGMFKYKPTLEELSQQIRQKKLSLKICSLSKSYDNILLWAYYASGFEGLAIEVELPNSSDILEMKYGDCHQISENDKNDTLGKAKEILTTKLAHWSHEEEIRILSEREEYFKLSQPIKRVIIGHRMSKINRDKIQKLCKNKNIELCETKPELHNKNTPSIKYEIIP